MKKFLMLFTFFISGSATANTFNFPECVNWFQTSTGLAPKETHFLCSRGNPAAVAQCVYGIIQNNLRFSTYGAMLLCDRGDFSRVNCAYAISGYQADYVTKVCNPEKDATIAAWEKFSKN